MIKRGSKVVWHRPAYDEMVEKTKYGRPVVGDNGKPIMENKHTPAKDYDCRCFGVLDRNGSSRSALVMKSKQRKMIEVPFDQLEETNEGRQRV